MDQDTLGLISGIKAGRNESFELLKAKYNPLLNDMAVRFEESGSGSRDDLFEEAQRALLKAAISFDTAKEGITFGLYAKICIRNALISVRRANAAKKRREEKITEKKEFKRARMLSSFGAMSADEILERIEGELSEYEAAVLKEYFSDRSAKETAAILKTSERSVNNAVYRIRQKAKALGESTSRK